VSALLLAALLAAPVDTLVVGLTADPVTLDPHRATDLVSAAVVSNVCEPLVRYRADGSRPEAALATSWATADSRTWTFTLRQDVRFHDGAPLDAAAVVANLDDLRKQRGFPGRAVRAGPFVVTITLDQPNAALLATLSQAFFAMQSPREIVRSSPRLVGTGPYRLESARPGRIELSANPQHWGGAPRLKRIVFRRLADQPALEAALLAGDVDVTSAVGQDTVGRLRGRPGITLDSQTGLNIAFLCPNNERRPSTTGGCARPSSAPSTAARWCATASAGTACPRATRCRPRCGATRAAPRSWDWTGPRPGASSPRPAIPTASRPHS
jgi:ABC-type transport system substrate-binding protein